ncbi:hypothetical protein ASG76_09215 [Nocardioides sp. Soil774]|nr:hypothetical protein ASG76_09215 [Nocardioides sp. Soil774]
MLWLMALASLVGVLLCAGISLAQGAAAPLVAASASVTVVAGARVVLGSGPPGCVTLGLLAAGCAILLWGVIAGWDQPIDVKLFVRGGLDALAHGQSPYAITISDVYEPGESARFYGPGVVQDGRVVVGYPYLPAVLLLDLPAHLLADAVWMHAAGVALALVLGWQVAIDRLGRVAIVVLALSPATPFLIANYWIEAVMVGIFALAWWSMHRHHGSLLAASLGLFFASKQYSVVFVPALWPILRSVGARVVLGAVAVGLIVVTPFVVLNPDAFVRSAVEFQLIQPFREDAVSLLPFVQSVAGEIPSPLTTVSLLVGLVASALVAARAKPGPTAFALCVGLGLLATVVIAKQAFLNYYAMIGAVLLLAGVGWPADDPSQTREPSSQGSRPRGISWTR